MLEQVANLDESQILFRDSVHRFMKQHASADKVRRWDENKEFPEQALGEMAKQGWFAITLPEAYGGIGGYMELACFLEAVAFHSVALARYWNINVNMVGGAIAAIGSEALRTRFLPELAQGRVRFAFALSENIAGSDATALRTRGALTEGGLLINGTKMWITGASVADYILTACRTDPGSSRHDGISLVLVPRNAPGLTINPIDLLGGHAVRTCEVHFDNVEVDQELIVGDVHAGWKRLLAILAKERVALAAMCVGAGQAAVDLAREYCTQREQFGRRLTAFQAVSHKIVDMQVQVNAARLLTYQAVSLLVRGLPCGQASSEAKLFASEAYMRLAMEGVQVMGANGYSMEYAMQRHFREAKLFQIFGGTSEIQKNTIAKEMGL